MLLKKKLRTEVKKTKGPWATLKIQLDGLGCTLDFDSAVGVSIIGKDLWAELGRLRLEKVKEKILDKGLNELRSAGWKWFALYGLPEHYKNNIKPITSSPKNK